MATIWTSSCYDCFIRVWLSICPVWCVKDLDMHWRICVAAGNNVAKLCQWPAEGAHCALYWKYLFIFAIFFLIFHNPHYLWFVHPQVSSPHILLLIQNSATSSLIRCSFMIGLIFAKMDPSTGLLWSQNCTEHLCRWARRILHWMMVVYIDLSILIVLYKSLGWV
jgi:hypothetical protein